MALLLFTPRTTIDANLLQYRLDNSIYHAEWNAWTGAYEFQEEEAKEKHEGLKSGKYERRHSYSLTYAKKAVNEAENNLEIAKRLWS